MIGTCLSSFTELREKTGLSIQDVADLTGRTPRTVYRWESDLTSAPKTVVDILLKKVRDAEREDIRKQPEFTFIDLFAGIGGLRMGFESVGGQCVFTSEWNKYSRETYQANFGCSHAVAGDITKLTSMTSHHMMYW